MNRLEQAVEDLNQWIPGTATHLGVLAIQRYATFEIRFLPMLLVFMFVEHHEMILAATGNLDADLP